MDPLNAQAKQRVVGAIVLVSLAVIFIPMILDGGGESMMGDSRSTIPAGPAPLKNVLEIPLQLPAQRPDTRRAFEQPLVVESEADAREMETQIRRTPLAAATVAAPGGEAPAEPAAGEKSETSPAVEPPASPALSSASAAATEPDPALRPAAWVVQVGSFGDSANALRLRDRLRAQDYAAFVEQVNTDTGIIYRVRVGPELQRTRAEALQLEIAERFEVKGLVVRHP